MYERLVAEYGPQQWWPAKSAFEVVIGAYLTQNTSWRAVERSIQNLAEHQTLNVEGIRNLDEVYLRELIRPSGYMVRKAAALKAFVYWLDREYGGSLEALAAAPTAESREQLLALPGVGPETADAILLYALGHPTMVVDEYLRRIVTRHHLLPEKAKYPEIQALAIEALKEQQAGNPRPALQRISRTHSHGRQNPLRPKTKVRRMPTFDVSYPRPRARPHYSKLMSTTTLYVATSNPGKLRDFAAAADHYGFAIAPLPCLDRIPPPPENEATFEGNARAKALYYSRLAPGYTVLADDSGLEVDALHGDPGVRSARYAADAGFTQTRVARWRQQSPLAARISPELRIVRHAIAAFSSSPATENVLLTAEGAVEGLIAEKPQGSGGFGYDPLFYLPELNKTMAEIDLATKSALSHRGRALRALFAKLKTTGDVATLPATRVTAPIPGGALSMTPCYCKARVHFVPRTQQLPSLTLLPSDTNNESCVSKLIQTLSALPPAKPGVHRTWQQPPHPLPRRPYGESSRFAPARETLSCFASCIRLPASCPSAHF